MPTWPVEAARTERLQQLVGREFALGPAQFEAEFDALEQALPFNCEHVVPQSWFTKKESRCAATYTTCLPASRAVTASAATPPTSTSPISFR